MIGTWYLDGGADGEDVAGEVVYFFDGVDSGVIFLGYGIEGVAFFYGVCLVGWLGTGNL